tara:strand:+ start:2606 stop:2953 length:348 start_codon:yes stop_codon:yes gene_type:complete
LNWVVRVTVVQFYYFFPVIIGAINIVAFYHIISNGRIVEVSFELVPFRFSGFTMRAPVYKEEENIDGAFAVICVGNIFEFGILSLAFVGVLINVIGNDGKQNEGQCGNNIILIRS